jgi:hypothetical protein
MPCPTRVPSSPGIKNGSCGSDDALELPRDEYCAEEAARSKNTGAGESNGFTTGGGATDVVCTTRLLLFNADFGVVLFVEFVLLARAGDACATGDVCGTANELLSGGDDTWGAAGVAGMPTSAADDGDAARCSDGAAGTTGRPGGGGFAAEAAAGDARGEGAPMMLLTGAGRAATVNCEATAGGSVPLPNRGGSAFFSGTSAVGRCGAF